MNVQHHRELQQARQRIARSRRAVQGDMSRVFESAKNKLNVRLQSQKHPLMMLLGATAVGIVLSRILSKLSGNQGWERTLFRWARANIGRRFWRQLLDMLMTKFRGGSDDDDQDDDDEQDAAPAEASS